MPWSAAVLHVEPHERDKVFGKQWGWSSAPHPEPKDALAWGPTPSQGPMLGPTNGMPRTPSGGALCLHTVRKPLKAHDLDLLVGRGQEALVRPAGKSLGTSSQDPGKSAWAWCAPRRSQSTPQLPPIKQTTH
mmetsp:Transcript_48470/g.122982  ORF Transcript_48470/g.122982 Transcript_48470/m.122982 type:complete len:132 (-) Transcript_48470:271-666(-)|eukprot:CAMPEP_0183438312 /NCGR_PEP_ID=MMETSP0370-20130417/77136_1 /TAXON_ID=268820 /ORGANISM="Peridinium aciculiferum, Strain PAER-2" /LENGTH=131 /DNA_ID=CAMNT_0025626495 /DNA_START=110 /DNA_END=505 /DNA_ORIENTATION=+